MLNNDNSDSGQFSGSLFNKLRSERLLINHEQLLLGNLNSKIDLAFNDLHKQVWICRHAQEILHKLINSDVAVTPANCCQLINGLNSSIFIEAYKVLNNFAAEIAQVYKLFSDAPKAVSLFLKSSEKIDTLYSIDELCSSIFNMLYGSCFFPEDERLFLELLRHSISLQLTNCTDPRKSLRKGNTTFSRMYKYFTEALPSTKIFLTAALHEPIMYLLSQDELFLDIDPSKSPLRIPATERCRRFGSDENSQSYKNKLALHRQIIVDKLVFLSKKLIESILKAMPIFPKSIAWLVSQMHQEIIGRRIVSEEEGALLCTELIFTHLICPALINPEPLGIISGTPISYVSRFNLMQIGQIIQNLVIVSYEQMFPACFDEILSHLDRNQIRTAMNGILFSNESTTILPAIISNPKRSENLRRRAFYGTLREINVLQAFLKSPAIEQIEDADLGERVSNILRKLPDSFSEDGKLSRLDEKTKVSLQTPASSSGLKNLVDRVHLVASRGHQRLMQTSSVSNLRNPQHRNLPNSSSANHLLNIEGHSIDSDLFCSEYCENTLKNEHVMIFSIPDLDGPFGMASEDKFTCKDDSLNIFPNDMVKCKAFMDLKRKLRLVLASATPLLERSDLSIILPNSTNPVDFTKELDMQNDALCHVLNFLLADSINNRNWKQTALIREVQRCLTLFDTTGIGNIVYALEEERHGRSAYLKHLQQMKLNLMSLDFCLEEMNKRIANDRNLTSECLVEIIIRFSLQKKELFLRQFVHGFQQLKVQDEKIDFVESHLNQLCEQLVVDPMWRFATLENMEYARKCYERSLMAHIYMFALFPNADADYYRDEVLHKSLQQLSATITVDHPELAIPKDLHTESPWPSAQAELGIINAYKSPRDKMTCIVQCCENIQNLVGLSSDRRTTSADEILPILVFVLIKANPSGLFSNLQFIDAFYARRMKGSEAYWWVQFNSAVEFLKILLNKLPLGKEA